MTCCAGWAPSANYRGFSYTAYAVLLCVQQQDRLLPDHQMALSGCGEAVWDKLEGGGSGTSEPVITVVWEQNRAMLEGLARRPLLQRPCAGAVPVHPVQQPPVRAEGGTGAELKRNTKRAERTRECIPECRAACSVLAGAVPRPRRGQAEIWRERKFR